MAASSPIFSRNISIRHTVSISGCLYRQPPSFLGEIETSDKKVVDHPSPLHRPRTFKTPGDKALVTFLHKSPREKTTLSLPQPEMSFRIALSLFKFRRTQQFPTKSKVHLSLLKTKIKYIVALGRINQSGNNISILLSNK